MTTTLTIASTSIRQDEHGRFCLNDLHVAAGAEERHKPQKWTRTESGAEIIEESKRTDMSFCPLVAKPGRYGGTYAVKELVYAYAMWVSPKFHLAVIRAYDQMVTSGRVQPTRQPAEMSRMEILQLALDSEQKRIEAETKLAIAAPKAEALDRIADMGESLTITETAKTLQMRRTALIAFLQALGWVYRRGVAGKQGRLSQFSDYLGKSDLHRAFFNSLFLTEIAS